MMRCQTRPPDPSSAATARSSPRPSQTGRPLMPSNSAANPWVKNINPRTRPLTNERKRSAGVFSVPTHHQFKGIEGRESGHQNAPAIAEAAAKPTMSADRRGADAKARPNERKAKRMEKLTAASERTLKSNQQEAKDRSWETQTVCNAQRYKRGDEHRNTQSK